MSQKTTVSGRLGTELYQAFFIHTALAFGTIVLLLAAAGFTVPYVAEVISPTDFFITPEDGPGAPPPAGQANLYPCIYPATETAINATDQLCPSTDSYCAEGFSCGESPLEEGLVACYNTQFECRNTTACWQHISTYPLLETTFGWELPFSLSITWLVVSFVSLAINLFLCIAELIYFIFVRVTTQIPDACKTFRRLPKKTKPKPQGSWGLVVLVVLYLVFCVMLNVPLILAYFFGLQDTFDLRRALWDGCFYEFNYWPLGNFYVFCMSFAAAIAILNFFNLVLLPATWNCVQKIRHPDTSALLSETMND